MHQGAEHSRRTYRELGIFLLQIGILVGLAIWSAYGHPLGPLIAVLIILPWFGLALLLQHADYRVPVTLAVGGSACLFFRARESFSYVNWVPPFLAAVLTAGVALFLVVKFRRQRREGLWLEVLVWAVCAVPYFYGAIAEANAWLDPSQPQVFQVKVLHRHVDRGRYTRFYLMLGPWGPRTQGGEVEVTGNSSLFYAAPPGSIVCVLLSRGGLGFPWYTVNPCR